MGIDIRETDIALAELGGWQRHVHLEEVWGTVVTFEVRGPDLDERREDLEEVVSRAAEHLHRIDDWFSTYRIDTPISSVRSGLIDEAEAPAVVRRVLEECRVARDLTQGVFDPWCVPGGVDPSGYVKGWAADLTADRFTEAGFGNVLVNASGDIACRGLQAPGTPWAVGIQHPRERDQIIKVVHVTDQAVATSGRYERGNHILDPRNGQAALALDAATVVGPDGGIAEALATALVVLGDAGVALFAGMPEWSGYLVRGDTAMSFGPAFEVHEDHNREGTP